MMCSMQNVKRPIHGGDVWRVSFLSEQAYPFTLEISVLRRVAETVPYAYRIHPAFLINYFDQHCMDRYNHYMEEGNDKTKDYHMEPNFMLEVGRLPQW